TEFTGIVSANNALHFDSSAVTIPLVLDSASGITMEGWFNVDGVAAFHQFLMLNGTYPNAYGLAIESNSMEVMISVGGSNYSSGHDISAGVWEHLALVIEGSTAKLFSDGSLVFETSVTPVVPSGQGYLGAMWPGANVLWGKADEIRMW